MAQAAETSPNSHRRVGFGSDFVTALGAGAAVKWTLSPMERMRLRVATAINTPPTSRAQDILNGFRRVVRDEGVFALWRGSVGNVLRFSTSQAILFSVQGVGSRALHRDGADAPSFTSRFLVHGSTGAVAGISALAVSYYSYRPRVMLAHEAMTVQAFAQQPWTVRTREKLRVRFEGFSLSAVRVAAYRLSYFGLYEATKPVVMSSVPEPWKDHFLVRLGLAYGTTMAAEVAAFPLLVVHRRMHAAPDGVNGIAKINRLVADIVRNEGVRAFFWGAGASAAKNAVAGSLILALVDQYARQREE